jgi:hypothetical protein
MNIAEFKSQYPQYEDMSDADLADALHAKYYSDIPKSAFFEQVGLPAKAAEPASPSSNPKIDTVSNPMATDDQPKKGLFDTAVDAVKGVASNVYEGVKHDLGFDEGKSVMDNLPKQAPVDRKGTDNPNLGPLRADYVARMSQQINSLPLDQQADLSKRDDSVGKIAKNVFDRNAQNQSNQAAGVPENLTDAQTAQRVLAQGGDGMQDVGFFESTGRATGEEFAGFGKAINLAVSVPAIVFDKVKSAVTGENSTGAQDWAFKQFVDPTQQAVDWYALKPQERQNFVSKVGSGIGHLLADLPLIIASGGTSEAAPAVEGTVSIWKHLGQSLDHGLTAMRPVMVKAGMDKAEQILNKGGTVEQAIEGGTTAALLTGASGAVPMSLEGSLLKRLASGVPVGMALSEVQRQAQNVVMPDNMQEPFSLENDLVGGVTGALMAGTMGGGNLRPNLSRAELGYRPNRTPMAEAVHEAIPDLQRASDIQPAAERQVINAPESSIADIAKAKSVDEAISSAVKSVPNIDAEAVGLKGDDLARHLEDSKTTIESVADQLKAIRPLEEVRDLDTPKEEERSVVEKNPVESMMAPELERTEPMDMAGETAQFYKPPGLDKAIADGVIPSSVTPLEFKLEPRTLTEREKLEQMRNVAGLNRALSAEGMQAVTPVYEPPSANHAIARAVADAFGAKVQFISGASGFDGVSHRGIAYLSDTMQKPELAISGHEVYHALEQTNPDLAGRLLDQVRAYLHDNVIENRQKWEQEQAGKPVSERYAAGEVMADLNGAMWMDHRFWREMIERDENLFRQVAYRFMEVATKAVDALTGSRFDASALVKDVEVVRSLIAQTWAEHNQARDAARSEFAAERFEPQFSREEPDVIIGFPLGEMVNHPDYQAAKAGSTEAAIRVVRDIVTPEFIAKIRAQIGDEKPIIQPVAAIEASGKNRIPSVAAARIASELVLPVGDQIVQSSSPKRTSLQGLDRVFNRPEFDGEVEAGRSYFLIDDTVTQGGTFAALSDYIDGHGGNVIGMAALTGKQYSARIGLTDLTLGALREKHGDIEQHFQAATGRGFDSLTESEARYLASFKPPESVRDRILQEGQSAHDRNGEAGLSQDEVNQPKFSRTSEENPPFYSHLERQIQQAPAKIDNGPAQQWKAWILSNASKLGIKAEEIKWSGITDYLDLMGKQKVSKEQISEYLAQNGVKVTEIIKGENPEPMRKGRELAESHGHDWESLSIADRRRYTQRANGHSLVEDIPSETKYGKYTLPGGENYRELLLTLPNRIGDKLAELKQRRAAIEEPYQRRGEDLPESVLPEWKSLNKQINELQSQKPTDYSSSHWDEPNILAHIRFNDRTDADGKRVLFIEELQSDWGQEGKKKGFSSVDANKPVVVFDAKTGENVARFKTGAEAEAYITQHDPKMVMLDYEDTTARGGIEKGKIPAAPFVTKTEAWLSLGIKRMIRYAAENGYDRIAFVNGEQSSARYDLSKQVSDLTAKKWDDSGKVGITFTDKNGNTHVAGEFKPDELEGVIGKDMANKVIADLSDASDGTVKKYSGLDLKVGGEGMKAFYDKIVPQTANEVLKRLGGGKVDSSIIKTGNAPDHVVAQYADQPDHPFTKAQRSTNLGFDITPEMRDQAMQGQPLFSRTDQTQEPTERLTDRASAKLSEFMKVPKEFMSDLKLLTVPMAEGTDVARKMAKDYANQERKAQWQWTKFDEILKKNFSEEQRRRMWEAADQENDLRREGRTSDTDGLNSLTPEERETVETLHAYGEALIQRARDNGMFEGEGVPYWTPRMAVMVSESGEYTRPKSGGEGASGDVGRNITTSASSLKHRKYLTSAETEAAMKVRLAEEGKEVQLVRDIRTMPMAMARLERAIAGRELINQIKALGTATGRELVTNAEGPGFFTIDHPAFKSWRPKFVEEDGRMVSARDQSGEMIFEKSPLYISNEFKGPLKAVMSVKPNAVYQGLMTLKSKSMGLIMYSPIIHNAVEWGRAIPAMDTKGKLTLGIYTYVTGNKAKNTPEVMREAIDHGLVPIGGRGAHMDITGIMDDPTLEVGRSWTAKALAAPVSLISERGALQVKKAVDAAGKFWHETLLWDRVADLQMGLYVSMKNSLINKGMAENDAAYIAAHFANRYAGALPRESMSEGARQFLNLTLFSRTFTMGNLGAMKDMIAGLPKDVQAQIRMSSGELALQAAQSFARKKAIATFIIDVGLMYVANSMFQDWLEKQRGDKTWTQIAQGYKDRYGKLADKLAKDPVAVLAHPFNSLESLTSTGENEPGKEERIKWGEDSTGTNIYVRLPTGKIGEEFANYADFPTGTMKQLKAKFSTFLRPLYETVTNDKGAGQKVYDDSKDASTAKNIGKVVVNFLKAQVPSDQIVAAYDLSTGHGDEMDVKKIVGPLFGLTFSKGAPGGPAVGEMYSEAREHQNKVTQIMPDVKRALKLGDEDKARELLESVDMTSKEINTVIRHIESPETRLSMGAMKNYQRHATEESKERMQNYK